MLNIVFSRFSFPRKVCRSDIGGISNRSNIDNSSNSNINGILGMFPICSSELYLYMSNYIESL